MVHIITNVPGMTNFNINSSDQDVVSIKFYTIYSLFLYVSSPCFNISFYYNYLFQITLHHQLLSKNLKPYVSWMHEETCYEQGSNMYSS